MVSALATTLHEGSENGKLGAVCAIGHLGQLSDELAGLAQHHLLPVLYRERKHDWSEAVQCGVAEALEKVTPLAKLTQQSSSPVH